MPLARRAFWLGLATVGYAYAGYPAALAALSRLRPARRHAGDLAELPPVTVLIAAYNESEVIERKLANTLALDYPAERLQVVVAADGSTDDTPARVSGFGDPRVELSFHPERRGKVAAINRAIGLARGEIVVFSDANNHYDPDALRQLVGPFGDPTVGGVVGSKRVVAGDGVLGESEGLYWRYEAFIQRKETELGSVTGAVGEIFAIRRELFEPPPEGIICEDLYMALRLVRRGYRVVYRPEARSLERVSASPEDEMKRRANIVAGRFQAMSLSGRLLPFGRPLLMWQVLSHKFLRPLVPLAMAVTFASNLVLVASRAGGVYALLFAGQLAFYGVAAAGRRLGVEGRLGRVVYLPTFLVQSNLAAVLGFYRFVSRRRTMHLWERVQRRT